MKNWFIEGGWTIVALLVILALLVGLLVVVDNYKAEQAGRLVQCQRQGYAGVIRFAGEHYCIRVDDGLLVGVRLESIDTTDAVREPGAHTLVRWE